MPVTGDDDFGSSRDSAFQNTIIIGIPLNDPQTFGWPDDFRHHPYLSIDQDDDFWGETELSFP
jgi:hypothetical protein